MRGLGSLETKEIKDDIFSLSEINLDRLSEIKRFIEDCSLSLEQLPFLFLKGNEKMLARTSVLG